jgi:hypothetical protein
VTTPVPVPPGGRLGSAEIGDRLLRQALEEAEMATRRVIELTQQAIELRAENAGLRAQLKLLRHGGMADAVGPPGPDDGA